mgnify:CR=1 FL=1
MFKLIRGIRMSTKQKSALIERILSHVRFHAKEHNKAFDEGDTFFSLCFKTDEELKQIAKLAGA